MDKPYDVQISPDTTLPYPANYRITVSGKKRFAIDDVFVLERSATQNLYAKVIDDSNSNSGIYYCKIEKKVEDYLNSIQSQWYSKPGWKMRVKNPIVLIDGINATTTGFAVSIYADQYIKIKYGSQEHIAIMSDRLVQGNWYGIVVNIGNSWGQYNVYVWKPSLIDNAQKLQTVFYETLQLTPEETTVEQYSIDKSYSYMTNIRLFNSTIEEEKQVQELLSYFTQNADQAIILDNADPKFRAPYISQQR
jgi:hypothetical protein